MNQDATRITFCGEHRSVMCDEDDAEEPAPGRPPYSPICEYARLLTYDEAGPSEGCRPAEHVLLPAHLHTEGANSNG